MHSESHSVLDFLLILNYIILYIQYIYCIVYHIKVLVYC